MPDLDMLVQQLADARVRAAKATQALQDAERAWRLGVGFTLLQGAQAAQERARRLEQEVRLAAVGSYVPGGAKKVHANVSIAMAKQVTFDHDRVFSWALKRGVCLRLDQDAFEDLARANVPHDENGPLAVVHEVPVARISSKIPLAV